LASVRPRQDLVLENLLLRHQLAALSRPTRRRRRARLRTWDKLLWVLARGWCVSWREHLTFVTADTVWAVGTGRASACSGVGGPPPVADARIPPPRYGT
jgi:hypothetical protein